MIFSYLLNMQSHPSWVCGLKQNSIVWILLNSQVTPFVGVWIETIYRYITGKRRKVTPFVGVWIETLFQSSGYLLPGVTPFVGVWIETLKNLQLQNERHSHTLRGCVD